MGGTESPLLMQESKVKWVSEQRKKPPKRHDQHCIHPWASNSSPFSQMSSHTPWLSLPTMLPQIASVYLEFKPLSSELQHFKLNYWLGIITISSNHALSNDSPATPWLHWNCVTSKPNLSVTKLATHPLNLSPSSCSHLVAPLNTFFSRTPAYWNRPKGSQFQLPKLSDATSFSLSRQGASHLNHLNN